MKIIKCICECCNKVHRITDREWYRANSPKCHACGKTLKPVRK